LHQPNVSATAETDPLVPTKKVVAAEVDPIVPTNIDVADEVDPVADEVSNCHQNCLCISQLYSGHCVMYF
jgi:hypothetical protein